MSLFFLRGTRFLRILANGLESFLFARYLRDLNRMSAVLISYMRLLAFADATVCKPPSHLNGVYHSQKPYTDDPSAFYSYSANDLQTRV
jgi:hypothetical protein